MQLLKRSNCSSFCLEVYNLIRDSKKRDPLTILGPGQPFPVYTPEVFHIVVGSSGEVFSNCSPLVAKLRLKLDDPLFFFRRELATSFDSAFVYITITLVIKRKKSYNHLTMINIILISTLTLLAVLTFLTNLCMYSQVTKQ